MDGCQVYHEVMSLVDCGVFVIVVVVVIVELVRTRRLR